MLAVKIQLEIKTGIKLYIYIYIYIYINYPCRDEGKWPSYHLVAQNL